MSPLFSIALVLVLLAAGFFVGRVREKRHYDSIRGRERDGLKTPVVSFEKLAPPRPVRSAQLAMGSVVVSIDYYKRFTSGFRLFFGGELGSYASLIDRARREALLRMRESHPNADMFINTRLETSSISQGEDDSTGSVEVLAYATALEFAE